MNRVLRCKEEVRARECTEDWKIGSKSQILRNLQIIEQAIWEGSISLKLEYFVVNCRRARPKLSRSYPINIKQEIILRVALQVPLPRPNVIFEV